MVKNSIRAGACDSLWWVPHSAGCGAQKKAGTLALPARGTRGRQPGRFIWQLVGVLETYGSIFLIGTKV
jgi:hypothetical protein